MQSVNQYIHTKLSDLYLYSEIEAIKSRILESVMGWNFTQQQVNRDIHLNHEKKKKILTVIDQLTTGKPIQYILKEVLFYDVELKINENVLIPRPETEELVDWILCVNKISNPSILDIGTGSGAIAIALKGHIKDAKLFAIDKSIKALKVARTNAEMNEVNIHFEKVNILQWQNYDFNHFDIIVSNPPYVMESEKKLMNNNVLDFEPKEALFVDDKNPLLFYKAIAEMGQKYLNKDGLLYLEINENLSSETKQLLSSLNYKNIEIRKDLQGKYRMARCQINR